MNRLSAHIATIRRAAALAAAA
ncbi:hypothetical protein LCGC14_1354700, partial [marine sediment metagenome]